jgi:hypothetical protein
MESGDFPGTLICSRCVIALHIAISAESLHILSIVQNIRPSLYALRLIAKHEADKAARYSPPHKILPLKPKPMQSIPGLASSAFNAIQKLTDGK